MAKNETGDTGELLARSFLLANNFTILHCNWRFHHKEIDIIAKKDNFLHIIEVKSRTTGYWEEPKYAVVKRKQKNMVEAAEGFVNRENIDLEVQFDIVSIIFDKNGGYQLEYIPNAFYPWEIN